MYFVYLKKKWRNQSANFPGDAEGGLCGVALTTKAWFFSSSVSFIFGAKYILCGQWLKLEIGGIVLVYGIDRVTQSRYKVDAKKNSINLAPAGEEEKPQTQEPVKNQ